MSDEATITDMHPGVDVVRQPRLSPHVELFITDRITRLVDDVIDQHSLGIAVTDVWKRQVVRNASAEIVRKVAEYIDSREISALSSLSSAKYHIDKVRKSIEDRRP